MPVDPELSALTYTERIVLCLALEPNSTSTDLAKDTGVSVGTVCSVLKPLELAGIAKSKMSWGYTNKLGHKTKNQKSWQLTDPDAILERLALTNDYRRMSA